MDASPHTHTQAETKLQRGNEGFEARFPPTRAQGAGETKNDSRSPNGGPRAPKSDPRPPQDSPVGELPPAVR